MTGFVIRRLASILAVLVVISVLVFAVTQILPGNVANVIAGQFASPDVIAALERKLGLDQPYYVQYWHWFSGVLSGHLGQSLVMDRPVGPVLWQALRASALLAVTAFAFVCVIGVSFGVLAAMQRNRFLDHAVSIFSYLGISMPEFFWGIVLIIVFARYLDWLPTGGAPEAGEPFRVQLSHLVLPTATLTFTLIAHVSRLTRSSMLDTLRSPYVRNARAKGLPERVVILRHALRNALLPTITVLAMDVGWLIGGIVVVEAVFSYPGLGRLLVFSIERHDLPFIQAAMLVIAAIYCFANLIADILYAFFNPKIRYG